MPVRDNPLFSSQWHFQFLGDIEAVWADYTGLGVHVGVFDEGTELSHPDLNDNYDATLHYNVGGITDDGQPIGSLAVHGTAVAGIIAAENNTIGGVGVAYDALVTGVNYLDNLQHLSGYLFIDSLRYGAAFDVMNNSWGTTPYYAVSQFLGDPFSYTSQMAGAYEEVVRDGRGGLGTIIVQAAGNEANDPYLSFDGILGSAQGDGLNSVHQLISVAAVGSDGQPAYYSNWGVNINVSAPAAAVTTDLTGFAGETTGDYMTDFSGTSAATPVVAGVAALMLQANPGLGWRDVQNILAFSAAHTGSALGAAASGYEVQAWFVNGASGWNGGGMTYNMNYGFGLVDAYAAVRMAEVWDRFYDQASVSSNMTAFEARYGGGTVNINDFSTATVSVTVSQNIMIEHIYVTIDGYHTYIGDLTAELISPSGETYSLFLNELNGEAFGGWTFGVTAALGDTSAGTWRVVVEDSEAGDVGYINDVVLEFEGSTLTPDTVYHFTDDFLTYAGSNAARLRISDSDGGHDWVNMAAISGDTVIALAQNSIVRVDGAAWQTLVNGQTLESVATGDGADRVTGNSLDNELFSGRGDDRILGLGGNDVLRGGEGNDSLYGSFGFDTLEGGAGDDLLEGEQNADVLLGDAGNDTLVGGEGTDRLEGGADDDQLFGGDGADRLFGGDGNDLIRAGTNFGNSVDGVEGGAGNDLMFGDFNADTFVFADGHGQDTIGDFDALSDIERIDLRGVSAITGLADLDLGSTTSGAATQVGANVLIDTGDGNSILLRGVDIADLGAGDFLF